MRFQKNSIQNSVFGIYLNWQMPVVRVIGQGQVCGRTVSANLQAVNGFANKEVQKRGYV